MKMSGKLEAALRIIVEHETYLASVFWMAAARRVWLRAASPAAMPAAPNAHPRQTPMTMVDMACHENQKINEHLFLMAAVSVPRMNGTPLSEEGITPHQKDPSRQFQSSLARLRSRFKAQQAH